MPESEKKEEESAESREEKKEQVSYSWKRFSLLYGISSFKERLKAAEAKRIEKERTEKYNKMKEESKTERQKYREKYKLPESPPRSDAEEESESEDEEDGFGPSKKVEKDPVEGELELESWQDLTRCFQRPRPLQRRRCLTRWGPPLRVWKK